MFALLIEAFNFNATKSLLSGFDDTLVCYGTVCFPSEQGSLNNYGEPRGYDDASPPYDRCGQNGCGH
jgi:hypothetical protein